ncbi:MAG: transglutaminase-like domain-containing protein [Pseudolabrys sp.]|nr:transglutaminase-like domain-containing protein [Pseudolabrys sp.]
MDMDQFLAAGEFVDSAAPPVIAFAKQATQGHTSTGAAILRLYSEIRDSIIYDPYVSLANPKNYRASTVLAAGRGFCIGKSALLAASARVIGVPARVGFADVRNHLTSPRLYEMVKTDTFTWHSYTELYLSGRWVKATPAFDRALCDRVGIKPLEFDGETDSLFQPFDQAGRRHMEYLKDRGTFSDVPFETIKADFIKSYPSLMNGDGLAGDFRSEAVAESMTEQRPDKTVG